MANKKDAAEQVRNVLGVGYFDNTRVVEDADPIEVISMKVHIDKLQKYDRNPRQSKNPEYHVLLELLRANGQEEALTITRRAGEEKYIIRRGGNTRLDIMKMLYRETGDQRFEFIDCLFMPWTSESDCIVGHLNENTSQGRMTLIDKARGYRNFKLEYEKEHNIEALGQRKLATLLQEAGSPINYQLLGIMNYALDVLEPAIPETLARGLGRPQIEKLKRLEKTFERLAEAHDLYEYETRNKQINAEFHKLLSDHDGDEWDMELVFHEFSQRLGELLKHVPYNRLKFDIDECQKQDPWNCKLTSTEEDQAQQGIQSLQTKISSAAKPNYSNTAPIMVKEPEPVKSSLERVLPENNPGSKQPNFELDQEAVALNLSTSTAIRKDELETDCTSNEFDLKSMQSRVFSLALDFAKATRIQHCLVHWDYGYGYFLDLPKTKLCTVMSTDQSCLEHFDHKVVTNRFSKERDDAERTFAWWLLWQLQGIVEFSDDPVPGYQLMPESMMKNLINQLYDPDNKRMYTMMLGAIGKITLQAGGPTNVVDMAMAYSYIKPTNMMKYISLLEARTRLMSFVEDNNINLWMDINHV
ncbi:MAG: hypothetical protein HOE12_11830 [Gammaproteobacteria bacterium]|jgi:ParB family protein of integrating conjugative element (PFGI_1 class)|nr:hypothetical protein [Gammaproteobacteria bacterium]